MDQIKECYAGGNRVKVSLPFVALGVNILANQI
jgi:hypothetical protein